MLAAGVGEGICGAGEAGAESRADPEDMKEVGADELVADLLGAAVTFEEGATVSLSVEANGFEGVRVGAPLLDIEPGNVVLIASTSGLIGRDEAMGIAVGKDLEEDPLDDGEHGERGADAEGKGEDDSDGEGGRSTHLAPGVAEILRDVFEPFACPHAARGFADEERVAEFAEDGVARGFGRLAAGDAIGGGHGDVGGDLFVDVVCASVPESHCSPPSGLTCMTAAMAPTTCCQRSWSEASCRLPAAVIW